MPVEMPSATRMVRPHPHSVVAKNDSLLADMNLSQRTPQGKKILKLPRRLIVIALDEMDRPAGQAIAICRHIIRSTQAEISEKIKCVMGLHRGIQSIHDDFIHLLRVSKRTTAVTNDVEVSKVKVGCKPSVSHRYDYAGIVPWMLTQ
jgi:hypothetical protein